MKNRNILEKLFESLLWRSRLISIIAVVFGILGSLVMFVVASFDVLKTCSIAFNFLVYHNIESDKFHGLLIGNIISSIDMYLIAVVLLIFSFGIYELFVSDIDDAFNTDVGNRILSIRSLDELKSKLGKVVVIVLIVSFFKKMLHINLHSPTDMLYFSISIILLAVALRIMHTDTAE